MQPVTITPITKMIRVRFSGKKVILPHHLQEHSNAYWHDLAANGKTYRRGEVFTVTQKDISDDAITVLVEKTDYAHYLYAQNHDDMRVHSIRIIHAAALVETSDKYFIFGKMGSHIARAGIYQLCGGGLDDGDLRGSDFDMTLNVTKELKEELGIDITDTTRVASCDTAFFKEGGPTDKMTVVYSIVLHDTKDDFMEKYAQFTEHLTAQNTVPEFESIAALAKDKDAIHAFFAHEDATYDEYMQPLFLHIAENLDAK